MLCIELAKLLGFTCQLKTMYALYAATLQSLSDESKEELQTWQDIGKEVWLKDDWSIEDECYYIMLPYVINDIPYTTKSYVNNAADVSFPGCEVRAIVTANGVDYFSISHLPNIIETHTAQAVLDQNVAISAFMDIYGMLLTKKNIVIDSMCFEYMPVPEPGYDFMQRFQIAPSWVFERKFSVAGKDGGDLTGHEDICLNAITGGEIG